MPHDRKVPWDGVGSRKRGAPDRASDRGAVGRYSSPRLEGKEFLVIDGHRIVVSDTWDREDRRCPRGR